jgi:hypothetical protein
MTEMVRHASQLRKLALRKAVDSDDQISSEHQLIAPDDVDEFLAAGLPSKSAELNDILERAIGLALQSRRQSLEVAFISLSAALESVLTFFRRQDEYEILPSADFSELERDLKKWLKQHPLLASEPARRGMIYEKVPELNRFPFSYVFRKFCDHHSLDLTDLWPVVGKHAEWPLTEIRHRLVHGDPFQSRPVEALTCAHTHLTWVVERMLLSVLGWPIARSNVSRVNLNRLGYNHERWQAERAKFA